MTASKAASLADDLLSYKIFSPPLWHRISKQLKTSLQWLHCQLWSRKYFSAQAMYFPDQAMF